MNLEKTIEFIQKAHANQVDKSNKPYWFHPVAVSIIVPGNIDVKIAALLHDVIEDTIYSLDDLKKLGYSEGVLEIVDLVTRIKEKGTYKEWIQSLADSKNIGAIYVKLADNLHNSSPSRVATLNRDAREGMGKRYYRARNILLKSLVDLDDKNLDYFISFCEDNKIRYDESLKEIKSERKKK